MKEESIMAKKVRFLVVIVLGFALIAGMVSTATAEMSFKGKTITFVVGFSAGGGFDTYTRLIARHFGKHVPGNPVTVVQNRSGAGSLIAANYVYNKARGDGTVVGNWIGPLILQHVMGRKAAQFDGRKFKFLGVPTADSGICALTKASGIKTPEDWFASKRDIKIGATGPGSTTDDPPKLLKEALGLPIKMVEGYGGTAKIRLAAESGEIDGGCWAWQSIKPTWRKGLESGNVRVVLQISNKSHPELKDVPLAMKYAKTAKARELLKVAGDAYGAIARPYSMPPGTPDEIVRLYQKAFLETLRDPQLLAEAKKSKIEVNPIDGPTIAKLMADLYKMDPALLSQLREILVPKKG
jgi:tripartite-type tricarboxylate transporter receptor subunit TctC